jgi:hypothetical protein
MFNHVHLDARKHDIQGTFSATLRLNTGAGINPVSKIHLPMPSKKFNEAQLTSICSENT